MRRPSRRHHSRAVRRIPWSSRIDCRSQRRWAEISGQMPCDIVLLAVFTPFIEIIVYLLPGRKVVWHHPPGNATTEQIEASIDDATHVIVRLLPPFLAFREEPCDEGPFPCHLSVSTEKSARKA